MSMAHECDLCGGLFKGAVGQVSIGNIDVLEDVKEGTFGNWSDLDFCSGCSAKILAVLKPALLDEEEAAG